MSFFDLPKEIRDFLRDPQAFDVVDEIVAVHELEEEDADRLLDLVEDVLLEKHPLSELPEVIAETFPLKAENKKAIAIDLAGQRLLPLADYVGNVAGYITLWGGDPTKFDQILRVEIASLKPELLVSEALKEVHVSLPDSSLQNRLAYLLGQYLLQKKTKEDIISVLPRSPKVGGLGLDEQTALGLMTIVEAKKAEQGSFFVSRAQEPIEIKEEHILPKAPQLTLLKIVDGSLDSQEELISQEKEREEEKKDLEIHKQKIEALASLPQVRDPKEAVARVLARGKNMKGLASELANEKTKERFLQIVESRMREVRNAFATKQQLELPPSQGGLGFSGAFLVQVVQLVEEIFSELRTQKQKIFQKKKNLLIQKQQEKLFPSALLEEKEKHLLSKRYVSMTGKIPTEHIAPASSSVVRSSIAKTPEETLAGQESLLDKEKIKTAIQETKKDIPVLPSRPQMRDIAPARSLAGPVEELSQMTLIDFRRLSADAKVASRKLQDKIDLLEEEGYEKKIQGIHAWRRSALFRFYVHLSEQLFLTGMSLEALLDKTKDPQGQQMTEQEFAEILSLNADLRF